MQHQHDKYIHFGSASVDASSVTSSTDDVVFECSLLLRLIKTITKQNRLEASGNNKQQAMPSCSVVPNLVVKDSLAEGDNTQHELAPEFIFSDADEPDPLKGFEVGANLLCSMVEGQSVNLNLETAAAACVNITVKQPTKQNPRAGVSANVTIIDIPVMESDDQFADADEIGTQWDPISDSIYSIADESDSLDVTETLGGLVLQGNLPEQGSDIIRGSTCEPSITSDDALQVCTLSPGSSHLAIPTPHDETTVEAAVDMISGVVAKDDKFEHGQKDSKNNLVCTRHCLFDSTPECDHELLTTGMVHLRIDKRCCQSVLHQQYVTFHHKNVGKERYVAWTEGPGHRPRWHAAFVCPVCVRCFCSQGIAVHIHVPETETTIHYKKKDALRDAAKHAVCMQPAPNDILNNIPSHVREKIKKLQRKL